MDRRCGPWTHSLWGEYKNRLAVDQGLRRFGTDIAWSSELRSAVQFGQAEQQTPHGVTGGQTLLKRF
jgi:hypothetical protein